MSASKQLPALLGGLPVRLARPPDWPVPDEDVLQALRDAYRNGSWGKYLGGNVEALEQKLRDYFAVPFVITCGSGTFAVELALRGLGVGSGDEVILASYDYPGNFLAIHAVGATPVLVDVARENWNLAPGSLEAARSPLTRAVIASHLHGGLVPMREVSSWATSHGIPILEDAAQAPGAMVDGRPAGTWGTVGILSFGGSKVLSAGRGGAMLTSDRRVHQRARVALQRGNSLCPLSELQAAVLIPQLAKLDERNAQRAASLEQIRQTIGELPGLGLFSNAPGENRPSYYKVGFQFDAWRFGLPRERFVAALRAEGMAFDEGFAAAHVGRSPGRFRSPGELPEASRAHHGVVVLHHPVLLGSPTEIEQVATAVQKVYASAELLNSADLGLRDFPQSFERGS